MIKWLKKKIKKEKQKRLYNAYIYKHKKNVLRAFYEMLQCHDLEWIMQDPDIYKPLWIRALDHDDSKFDPEEYDAYRAHFFPIDKEEKEENAAAFEKAWEHHWKNNDHHWQARVTWKDEDFNINTELACLENIMDWLAMGYEFHDRPFEYYEKNKDKITLPEKQKQFIEKCIYQGIDKKNVLMKEGKFDVWNEL